jgi:hypothetical protein
MAVSRGLLRPRLLWQHGVAAAATVGVHALWMAIIPSVVPRAIEALVSPSSARSPRLFAVPEPYVTVNVDVEPLGMALSVLGIAGLCILGRVGLGRWPFLSWTLPLGAGLLAGLLWGLASRDVTLGRPIGVLIGVGAGLMAFTLVGAYWWTLLFTSTRRAAGRG